MIDKREQILARLVEVAAAVDGVAAAVRNCTDAPSLPNVSNRPAIIIHDMDEQAVGGQSGEMDTRAPRRTAIKFMQMTPYIAIRVAAGSIDLGTLLNLYRGRLVSAVLNDTALQSLIGQSGCIEYAGCATHPLETNGREGTMEVDLTFTYVFRAADLNA